jgi:hypothetical protein
LIAPVELVRDVIGMLDGLGIRYHLGGSLASSYYGLSRTTADVDLVIEASREQLDALADLLSVRFYVSLEAMAEAFVDRRSFNAILLDGPFKVDFFLVGKRPFDQEEFRRAGVRDIGLPGASFVRIKSAEDLVLRKLEWYRLGNEVSERQWSDVVGVLRAMRGQLDEVHLDHWATELALTDLLTRARAEAERG